MVVHAEQLIPRSELRKVGGVSPELVRESILEPSMEATAHNLDQFNPSPEIDSLLEHLEAEANRLPDCPSKHRMVALIGQAIESNLREGNDRLLINGAADQLITDLKGARALSTGWKGPKRLAMEMRQPLKDYRAGGALAAIVTENIRTQPRTGLLNERVRYELGKKLYAVLEDLVGEMDASG